MRTSCLALTAASFLTVAAATAGSAQPERNPPPSALLGARMQRTVSLLATSTPQRRNPVTILVYGQSITAGLKGSRLEQALRERFPHAELTLLNRSISGFSATQLVRAAVHDVYPLYPDLVILHDYGAASIEFERIVENIRRYTTAEILLITHHISSNPSENKRFSDDRESWAVRLLAQKYNCELADIRSEWQDYLRANNLNPQDLLTDTVHLNARGLDLMVDLLLEHFQWQPYLPNDWMRTVRSYEAQRWPDEGREDGVTFTSKPWRFMHSSAIGESRESALRLVFQGNRVDCVLRFVPGMKPGTAAVRIDGKSPSSLTELWAHTIPSSSCGTPWQPAVRRISHRVPLVPETWKIVFRDIREEASRFRFEVHGSRTGFDGAGEFDASKYKYGTYGDILDYAGADPYPDVFVSNSGRVVIDHRDFKIPWSSTYSKKPCPEGFEATWGSVPLFTEILTAPAEAAPGKVHLVTLAKGLTNGTHTLEIVPNGDGVVPIERLIVHEPPLK
ncbi:MAG: SGNH/GDSL hydrolase family protein [Bryobacteraceae bacterium]